MLDTEHWAQGTWYGQAWLEFAVKRNWWFLPESNFVWRVSVLVAINFARDILFYLIHVKTVSTGHVMMLLSQYIILSSRWVAYNIFSSFKFSFSIFSERGINFGCYCSALKFCIGAIFVSVIIYDWLNMSIVAGQSTDEKWWNRAWKIYHHKESNESARRLSRC